MCKFWNSMAHGHFWGWMSFSYASVSQNVLRESIGQTLQLSFAPNLDMSRLVPKFTATTSSVEQDLDGNSLWMEI